jgi:YD repeat-containing protein
VSGANGGQDQTFSYDGLNRLIRSTLNLSNTDYEYDLDGNRRTAGSTTYVFNRADQVSSKHERCVRVRPLRQPADEPRESDGHGDLHVRPGRSPQDDL